MEESQGPPVLVRRPWGTRLGPSPFTPAYPLQSEDITVHTIGHAFGKVPPAVEPGGKTVYFVNDFLIDQSQSTGGGSFLADPIHFDLTKRSGYRYQILSHATKHFLVNLPSNVSSIYFSAFLGRIQTNAVQGGSFSSITAQVSFQGLVGTPPNLTYDNFFITQANNQALLFEIEGEITSALQFDAIVIQTAFSRAFDPGAKSYDPLSYAVPLGTHEIYPKSETFVLFGYQTSDAIDPGPFVTLGK